MTAPTCQLCANAYAVVIVEDKAGQERAVCNACWRTLHHDEAAVVVTRFAREP